MEEEMLDSNRPEIIHEFNCGGCGHVMGKLAILLWDFSEAKISISQRYNLAKKADCRPKKPRWKWAPESRQILKNFHKFMADRNRRNIVIYRYRKLEMWPSAPGKGLSHF